MKRILGTIGVIIFAFILVACGTKLGVPKNVKITGDVLSWDAVDGAEGYLVIVDSAEHATTVTSFDLSSLSLAVGTYSIGVKATANDLTSDVSTKVSYVVSDGLSETLNAPQNVKLSEGVFSWDAVNGATSYIVLVGTTEHNVSTTTFDLKNLNLTEGNHAISVKAVKGEIQSQASTSLDYHIVKPISTTAKEAMLKRINSNYKLDMVENNFPSFSQYYYYTSYVLGLEAYILNAQIAGLSETQLVDLFDLVADLGQGLIIVEDLESTIELFTEFLDLGLTSELLSNVLYETLYIRTQYMYSPTMIEERESYIKEEERAYIAKINGLTNFVEFFETFATKEQVLAFESLFKDNTMYAYYGDSLYYQIDWLLWGVENNKPIEEIQMFEEFSEIAGVLYELFVDLYEKDNQIFFNLQKFIYEFEYSDANRYRREIYNLINSLEDLKQEIAENEMTLELLGKNETHIINAYKEAFEFAALLHEVVLQEGIFAIVDKLVASGNITNAEIIILKDELVTILREFVPSAENLKLVYDALIVASADYMGTELEVEIDTNLVAEVSVLTINVMLDLLDEVDVDFIVGIQGLINEDYNISAQAINLLIYTMEYYEDFIQTSKDKYGAILTDEVLEDIYQQVLPLVIKYDDSEAAIAYLLDKYDVFKDFVDIFDDAVMPVLKLMQLNFFGFTGQQSDAPFIDVINAYFDVIESVFNDFTEEKALAVTNVMAMVFELQAIVNDSEMPFNFESFYTEEKDNIVEVFMNLSSIINSITTQADQIDEDDFINNKNLETGTDKDPQYKLFFYMVTILDKGLTNETKTVIDETIELLFEDILKNTHIAILFDEEMNPNAPKEEMNENVDFLLGRIEHFAQMDYNNLSDEQWIEVEEMVDSIFNNPNPPYDFSQAIELEVDFKNGPIAINIDLENNDVVIYKLIYKEERMLYIYPSNLEGEAYMEVFESYDLFYPWHEFYGFEAELYLHDAYVYVVFGSFEGVSYTVTIDNQPYSMFSNSETIELNGENIQFDVSLSNDGDYSVYKIVVNKPGNYLIYSSENTGDPFLEIYFDKIYLSVYDDSDDLNFYVEQLFDADETTYYLVFKGFYEKADYKVNIEYTSPNFDEALELELNFEEGPIQLLLNYDNDEQFVVYKLNYEEGPLYIYTEDHDVDATMMVHYPYDLFNPWDVFKGFEVEYFMDKHYMEEGYLYVVFSHIEGIPYTVFIDDEPYNIFSTSKMLELVGSEVNLEIEASGGRVQTYELTVTQPGTYRIFSYDNNGDLRLSIYENKKSLLDYAAGESNFELTFTFYEEQMYHLVFDNYNWDYGYNVRIEYLPLV